MLCKQQHTLVLIVQLTKECTAHTLRKRLSNDPPVGDRALYCNAPTGSLGEHGHAIYQLSPTAVILSQALRQAGSDSGTLAFSDFEMAQLTTMIGKCCLNTLRLKTVMTSLMPSDSFMNTSVAKYNFQKLYSLHTLVARLNAIHFDSAASSANPDDPGGLHSGLCDADRQHLAGSWSL